jgi:hypothetical protein
MELTPQPEFTGIRSITFYATDGEKMTASNTVNITVIPSSPEQVPEEEQTESTSEESQENVTLNITCNELYWFDSNSTECSQKEFCGTYMYLGLHTFSTLEECQENLPQISAPEEENETEENETANDTIQTFPAINETNNETESLCENEAVCSLKETTPKGPNILANATNQTSQPTSTPVKSNFWKDYQSYILLAILIAIIIILVISGLGKKILSFFEEEPEKKK